MTKKKRRPGPQKTVRVARINRELDTVAWSLRDERPEGKKHWIGSGFDRPRSEAATKWRQRADKTAASLAKQHRAFDQDRFLRRCNRA